MARGQDSSSTKAVARRTTADGDLVVEISFDSKINLFPTRDEIEQRLDNLAKYPAAKSQAKNWKKVLPKRELNKIERFNAFYTLLELELQNGISADEIESMAAELEVAGDFSPQKTLALHRLQNIIPFLEIPSPSGESFKKMLSENARGEEILACAAKEEDVDAIHHAARIIEMLSVSRLDHRVPFFEEGVQENFAWARERSQISNRFVDHLPVVVSPDSLWMLGFSDEVTIIPKILKAKAFLNGFAYSALPGEGGVEPTVIVAHTEHGAEGEYLNVSMLRKTMVHEMIHDTQEYHISGIEDNLPDGWSQIESVQLLEGLTDGLAILRLKENDQSQALVNSGPYQHYVSSLFSLLREAGVEEADFEDRLTYLNNIPFTQAVDLLGEWSGRDNIKEVFQENLRPDLPQVKKSSVIFRPIKTFRQVKDALEEHQETSISLIKEVFESSPIFTTKGT